MAVPGPLIRGSTRPSTVDEVKRREAGRRIFLTAAAIRCGAAWMAGMKVGHDVRKADSETSNERDESQKCSDNWPLSR